MSYNTPAEARIYRLRSRFNLTVEQYDAMHEAQAGLCAICGRPETHRSMGVLRRLAVDHCHETGRVRALLCGTCNRGIGQLQDSSELLRKAADYLERHT